MPILTWLTDLLPTGSDDPVSKAVNDEKARDTRRNSWALAGSKTMSDDYKRVTHVAGGKTAGNAVSLGAPPPPPRATIKK